MQIEIFNHSFHILIRTQLKVKGTIPGLKPSRLLPLSKTLNQFKLKRCCSVDSLRGDIKFY